MPDLSAARALLGLRFVLAFLILMHPLARMVYGGVPPFGAWLDSLGFPQGIAWAWFVTGFELVAVPLLMLGRLLRPVVAVLVAIYTLGIVLVHAPAGWFVVGLGRNGCEYSVLLIASLLAVAWAAPARKGRVYLR